MWEVERRKKRWRGGRRSVGVLAGKEERGRGRKVCWFYGRGEKERR